MSAAPPPPPAAPPPGPVEQELADEAFRLDLEDQDSLEASAEGALVPGDFPEVEATNELAQYAKQIAGAVIADKTRTNYIRVAQSYIIFTRASHPDFNPQSKNE
uniref:Uncharacterized protein n=1 Tax=Mycena chlorophos TaxID=658473 RepID=A0ABQ0L1G2_MYCCL|nr:predicted protein [Mycena chlorophos]